MIWKISDEARSIVCIELGKVLKMEMKWWLSSQGKNAMINQIPLKL